jgi:hypothetical protein
MLSWFWQPFRSEEEKIEFVKAMRAKLCQPEMLLPDGSIDQEFFRPKQVGWNLCSWLLSPIQCAFRLGRSIRARVAT